MGENPSLNHHDTCTPSSETQGQSVGGGRNSTKKVFKNGRRSPWVPSLTGPFPNGFANPGSRLGRKKPLYYSAQSASSNSRITFVCSYTAIVVPPYLSGSFTKDKRARETFSLTFLTGDERTNDDLGKSLQLLAAKTFPISTEKILFLTDHKMP